MMLPDRPENTFKAQVKHRVEQEALNAAQLDDLLSMQQDLLKHTTKPRWRRPQLFAAAATVCLFMLAFLNWPHAGQSDRLAAIANEVAKNHLKQRPMELDTRSMAAVQSFFTELEFSPVSSNYLQDRLAEVKPQLLGARYCSIQGVTAAQLRYVGSANEKSTLYEVGYDPHIFGDIPKIDRQAPIEMQVKGLNVALWVESGLLMALIEEPNPRVIDR
ncbi:hypothetical protein [Neptunomonas sp. XY-337]|uniref:hypothetical protein n=1 Tax=Neptunomonas sp. XY-337 TaxID=2561897 RepID=UPI0010AACEEE|nr:hypothetical protein [Neptunomonas sp. XY-337]